MLSFSKCPLSSLGVCSIYISISQPCSRRCSHGILSEVLYFWAVLQVYAPPPLLSLSGVHSSLLSPFSPAGPLCVDMICLSPREDISAPSLPLPISTLLSGDGYGIHPSLSRRCSHAMGTVYTRHTTSLNSEGITKSTPRINVPPRTKAMRESTIPDGQVLYSSY